MGATRSIIIVVVAAVFALMAALVVGRLMARPAKPQPVMAAAPAKPMAQVLVAQHDLTVGTAITANDVTWQGWPVDALNPAFITDGQAPKAPPTGAAAAVATKVSNAAVKAVSRSPIDSLAGAIVRETILANEPITNAKLVRGGEGGFMAVVLHPGMRAVAVPVNAATAAGGFILPGDRVDVLQSHQQQDNGQVAGSAMFASRAGQVAQVLLRNVRVLAIDQAAKPPRNTPSMIGAVATLEVPAASAGLLVRAKAQGEIVLALRSYSDSKGPAINPQGDATAAGIVRIFRDGKPSEVMVSP